MAAPSENDASSAFWRPRFFRGADLQQAPHGRRVSQLIELPGFLKAFYRILIEIFKEIERTEDKGPGMDWWWSAGGGEEVEGSGQL